MKYRLLGATGLKVSEIGMGCWGLGSDAYGTTDDDVSLTALEEAVEQGINFFDTADIYGSGRSENLVGEALRKVRHDVIIATKVGSLPHTGKTMPVALSPKHIRQSLENSLERLRTGYIDLYQLHSPPVELISDALDTLEQIQKEGDIRFIGVSAKSPDDALIAIEDPRVDVVQINFNMIDQRAIDNGLLARCKDAKIGVIARTPLAFGFLSGRYAKGATFQAPDHRANWSQEQIDIWAKSGKLFRCTPGLTRTQFALAYCLSNDAVSTTIPGMMSPEEVVENTITQYELTKAELNSIWRVYQSNNFFVGK